MFSMMSNAFPEPPAGRLMAWPRPGAGSWSKSCGPSACPQGRKFCALIRARLSARCGLPRGRPRRPAARAAPGKRHSACCQQFANSVRKAKLQDDLFLKIINRELPADIVYEDDDILAFRDINPAAPVHVLVIPKRHIATTNELAPDDAELVGRLVLTSQRIDRKSTRLNSSHVDISYAVLCLT